MNIIRRRNSLSFLISTGFIIIIIITAFSSILGYERLNNFNNILKEITGNSLPQAAKVGELNSALKEILYLAERLTITTNLASRRITVEKLQNQEEKLLNLMDNFVGTTHLNNQLKTVKKELADLDKLVSQRLQNQQRIQDLNEEVYNLNDKIVTHLNQQRTSKIIEQSLMLLFKASSLKHKAESSDRLQTVRQIEKELGNNLHNILANSRILEPKIGKAALEQISQLKSILLDKPGWFSLKIEQLQIAGRVRGRGNFLHNLIVDTNTLSEAKFDNINKKIIHNAQHAANQISQQVIWVIGLSITLLILMSATIYLIKVKIVARILNLNNSVIKRIKSQEAPINTSGKDEISHLAQSFVYFSEKVEEQKQQLQTLSLTDVLTNLPNRRALDERLEHDVHTAKRSQTSLSVIILDIDYFKLYNDFYGHIAGDECLQNVADALKNIQQRDSDFIARYGGEEFVMLLPQTDKDGAIKVAKRVKELLDILNIPHQKSLVADHVTVSLGIATFSNKNISTVYKILNRADEALYKAKDSGRNTYFHTDDIMNIDVNI
ncbi:GGDEF domain-containing protein [Psychrosphaera aquimarina]|uniref:diguanylate cyclase n=1 Tax=Psychrosphaera aquimarina TaxID=2044854 RepID=A0ABU3QWQ1_9GAMM|nr:GGDEF domain-containing protein [Psychrosphaera aquimarina]MDU0111864.1 GGDEF domain-containing protein [Psychrosphaera aquimarina]